MTVDKQFRKDSPLANLDRQPDPRMSREQLTEELEGLRALTSGLLKTFPVAFIILDRQWRIAYLNKNALEFFEDTSESLIGKALEDEYPRKLGFLLAPDTIRKLLKGDKNWMEKYTHYTHRWYKISASSTDAGIFIRLEDITSEMLVNRLLRLNEFSVNRARDMVFWSKPGGHIIYANVAACNSLGYDAEELTKKKMADIGTYYSSGKWEEFIRELKNNGSMTYESFLRAGDGRSIPVEVTSDYLDYHGDEFVISFARNITERKKAETALTESKAEAELYVDLMSHDINNMNQVALGYLELALDLLDARGRVDREHAEMISKPYEMLLNSSKLIDNVRKVRTEKSGYYRHRVIDVYKVLEDVKNNYPVVVGRDIRIELTGKDKCFTEANELLKDVFLNLVGNSIKHSSGPVLISIDISKITEEGKPYCRISVEDDGPGIADDKKAQLLDRIATGNAQVRGKGFGLYLIKHLVSGFGGRFWVEDRIPGDHTKGAKFVVILPAA